MTFLRRMLERVFRRPIGTVVVPTNPMHARTLAAADAVLADPKIRRLLSVREREMKAAFARQGRRLRR